MSENVSAKVAEPLQLRRWPPLLKGAGMYLGIAQDQPAKVNWHWTFGLSTGPYQPLMTPLDESLERVFGETSADAGAICDTIALLYSIGYDVGPGALQAVVLALNFQIADTKDVANTFTVDVAGNHDQSVEYFNLVLLCMSKIESRVYIDSLGRGVIHGAQVSPTRITLFLKSSGNNMQRYLARGVGMITRTPAYRRTAIEMADSLLRGMISHCPQLNDEAVKVMLGLSLSKYWRCPLVGVNDARSFANFVGMSHQDMENSERRYVQAILTGRYFAMTTRSPQAFDLKVLLGSFMINCQEFALRRCINGAEIRVSRETDSLVDRTLLAGVQSELSRHGGHVLFYGCLLPFKYPLSEQAITSLDIHVGQTLATVRLEGTIEEKTRLFNFFSALLGVDLSLDITGLLPFGVPYRRASMDIISVGSYSNGHFDRRVISPYFAVNHAAPLLAQPCSVTFAVDRVRGRFYTSKTREEDNPDVIGFSKLASAFMDHWQKLVTRSSPFV